MLQGDTQHLAPAVEIDEVGEQTGCVSRVLEMSMPFNPVTFLKYIPGKQFQKKIKCSQDYG